MYILEMITFCSDPALAKILSIMKNVLDLIQLVGPIIGIIALTINLIKLMASPEDKKLKNVIRNWAISIFMLFLMPTIINLFMGLFEDDFQLSACWVAASVYDTNSSSKYYSMSEDEKSSFFDGSVINNPTTGSTTGSGSGTSLGSSGTSSGSFSSHTNSVNGLTFNLYSQTDPLWANITYSDSTKTIGDIGCMITSIAVVSSANNKSITPQTVFNSTYRHSYPRDAINALASGKFSCTYGSTSSSSIINALQSGNIVVIMVQGRNRGYSSPFTSSQHYMALIDISGNNIFVGNAYSTSTYGKSGWFSSSDVLNSVTTADYCTVK